MIKSVRLCLAAALLMQALSIAALISAFFSHGFHQTDGFIICWGAMILAQLFVLHARLAVDR